MKIGKATLVSHRDWPVNRTSTFKISRDLQGSGHPVKLRFDDGVHKVIHILIEFFILHKI